MRTRPASATMSSGQFGSTTRRAVVLAVGLALGVAALLAWVALPGAGVAPPARAGSAAVAPVVPEVAAPLSSGSPAVDQCNGIANVGGQEVQCQVTVTNHLDVATGTTSSTVTVQACSGATSGTLTCTTSTVTSSVLVTSVNQCNGSGGGGGGAATCTVDVVNTITGTATPTAASIDQCVGSGTGGGTQPTVSCTPLGDTTNATITQCNTSGNGGGGTMRVQCTVDPSTETSAVPITVNQCNGSANGGGATVTCTTSLTNDIIAVAPAPSLAISKSASPTTVSAVGQSISYSFLVTDTGNVAVGDIAVTDTQSAPAGVLTAPPACPDPTLEPSGTETCTASYEVTLADLEHGSISDSAVATGMYLSSPVSSLPSTAVVSAIVPAPAPVPGASGAAAAPTAVATPTAGAAGSADVAPRGSTAGGGVGAGVARASASGATSAARGSLAVTGLGFLPLMEAAAVLVMGGAAILVVVRRRRRPI